MNKYEAMLIVRADLSEEDKKSLCASIAEAITKNGGEVNEAGVWIERKKLAFMIKRYPEGTYYLVNFNAPAQAITKIRYAYRLNEYILRSLITRP
ncbi:MAG: 30S ribosomal protein S6 [Candidatus Omnitrophota bacterium]|nr:30S ribosomal protein S6 [Candidatus Omnitrophota bacterium]